MKRCMSIYVEMGSIVFSRKNSYLRCCVTCMCCCSLYIQREFMAYLVFPFSIHIAGTERGAVGNYHCVFFSAMTKLCSLETGCCHSWLSTEVLHELFTSFKWFFETPPEIFRLDSLTEQRHPLSSQDTYLSPCRKAEVQKNLMFSIFHQWL